MLVLFFFLVHIVYKCSSEALTILLAPVTVYIYHFNNNCLIYL